MPKNNYCVCLVLVTLGLVSCKPKSQSTVESLDNYAAGSARFHMNQCNIRDAAVDAKYQDRFDAEGDNEAKANLIELSSIVPVGFRKMFFDAPLNGQIKLVSNLSNACELRSDVSEDQLLSCRGIGQDGKSLVIFIRKGKSLEETTKIVQHSLVRAHAYVLSEVVLETLPNSTILKDLAQEFAARYLHDLVNMPNGDAKKIAMIKQDIGNDAIVSGSMSLAERRAAFRNLDEGKRMKFAKEILAEIVDSLKCSGDTKDTLSTNFKTVFQGDTSITGPKSDDDLRSISAEIAVDEVLAALSEAEAKSAGLVADNANDDGLSLWGRWGYGGGPIRNGLGNWAGWRQGGGGVFNFRRFGSGGRFLWR